MCNKLKSICINIGQKLVYLILPDLFYYSNITKFKKYKNLMMQIFAEV